MDLSKTGFTEMPQRCISCGIINETRPYGKNNEEICIDCGLKDPETTSLKMMENMLISLALGSNDGNFGDFPNHE